MMTRFGYLFVLLVILILSCATTHPVPISSDGLPELKGKWKGYMVMTNGTIESTQDTELEILTENLKGKVIFHGTPAGTVSHPFHAKLEGGKFLCVWEKDRVMSLNLYKDGGKMILKGDLRWREWRGTIFFRKIT